MAPTNHPFLGDLELLVMEHVWGRGETAVKALHDVVGRPRDITLNTVQSTLKRLHDKGLLRRRKVSHAYLYAAAVSRADFHRSVLHAVVDQVMDGEPAAMLAAFVDVTERAGQDQLARLEELVARRLHATRRGEDDAG